MRIWVCLLGMTLLSGCCLNQHSQKGYQRWPACILPVKSESLAPSPAPLVPAQSVPVPPEKSSAIPLSPSLVQLPGRLMGPSCTMGQTELSSRVTKLG
ncbi:hypothetical protein SAMN02745129_4046 [Ferrimonas marina]|uniref:Uncharacterized protein n=1 Tax=Ferrimonas marina TaxID=299255 RepID=A0A1M5YBK7_9GAMM|nr:hypothetical protein SAMN02745129_4046 [Ferrimonas marina]